MTKDEFITLLQEARERNGEWSDGEWDRDTAIDMSFMEGNAFAEVLAEKRKLEELKELIEESHQERSNENDQ